MGWFNIQNLLLSAVCLFSMVSIYVMITHEIHITITFGPSGMTDSKQHEMLHSKSLKSVSLKSTEPSSSSPKVGSSTSTMKVSSLSKSDLVKLQNSKQLSRSHQS